MAITGQPSITPYWYTPEGQDEPVTAFNLKPLTAREGAEVFSSISFHGESGGATLTYETSSLAIKHGLIGWRNFFDREGKEIEFSKENINRLPPLVFLSVATVIINSTVFGEEEKKT